MLNDIVDLFFSRPYSYAGIMFVSVFALGYIGLAYAHWRDEYRVPKHLPSFDFEKTDDLMCDCGHIMEVASIGQVHCPDCGVIR
jgi:hypothetical protein